MWHGSDPPARRVLLSPTDRRLRLAPSAPIQSILASASRSPIVRSSSLTPRRPRSNSSTLSPSPPATTLTASGSTLTGTGTGTGGGSHLSTAETSLFSDDGEEPHGGRSGFGWVADKSIPGLEGWDGGGGGGGGGNSFADDLLVIDELPEGELTTDDDNAGESEAEPTPRYASTSTSWPTRAAREGSATLPSFGGASRAGLLVDITPPPSADSFQSTTPPGPGPTAAAAGWWSTSRSLAGAKGLQHLLGEVEERTLLRLQHEPTFVSSSSSTSFPASSAYPNTSGPRARIPSGGGVDSVRRLREAFARAQDSPRTTGGRTASSPNTTRQPPAQPVWNPYTLTSGPASGAGTSASRSKAAVQSWLSTSQTSLPSPPRLLSPPAQHATTLPVERRTIVPHPNELRSARGFPPPEHRQRTISRSPEPPAGSTTDDQEPLGTDEDSPPTPPMRVPPAFSSRHGADASGLHHRSTAFEEEATPPVRLPAGFGLYDESSLLGPLGRHMPDRSAGTAGATFDDEPTPAPSYARHRSRTPPAFDSPLAGARTAREQAGSPLQTFMAFQHAGPAQTTPRSMPLQTQTPLQPQPTPARPLASRASLSPAIAAHSTPPPPAAHADPSYRSRTRTSSTAKGKARAQAFDAPSPSSTAGRDLYADSPSSSMYATPGRGGAAEEDESLAFKPSRQLRRSPSKSFATPGPSPFVPQAAASVSRAKASSGISSQVAHPMAQRSSTPPASPAAHASPQSAQVIPPSPHRSSLRKSTSFVLPPSSTSPSTSAYVSPLRAIVGSPSRERFSPRRMSTPPPAAPVFVTDSAEWEEEVDARGQGQSDGHDAESERPDASVPPLEREPSVFASEDEPVGAGLEDLAEAGSEIDDGDEVFDSIPLSPPAAVAVPPVRSQTPQARQAASAAPAKLAPSVAQTPARRAIYGSLAPPGTVGAPTPRAPGGWCWTPGGAAGKGKGRASTAPDVEDEVVVLRRRKVESSPLAAAPPAPQLPPTPAAIQQRVVSLPSSVPRRFSPSSSRTLLTTPVRQSPAIRRLSFSLSPARSPASPATPSRLRIAHLRRQLGEVEAEERAVLDRVKVVRREVEEVRWVKARRSQDVPVTTDAKAGRWAWWAAVVALWWIGLSIVHSLQAPSAVDSPYHPALYAPQVSANTSPLFALAPTLPLGLSAFELPGKVRAGWLVALGTVLGGSGGSSEGAVFWEGLVNHGGGEEMLGSW